VPLQPIRAAPPPPPANPVVVAPAAEAVEENETLVELQRRQLLFKQAALSAKKSGDTETAVKYLKVSKVSNYCFEVLKFSRTIAQFIQVITANHVNVLKHKLLSWVVKKSIFD